jgi:biotin carboxyl carrier protein
MELIVLSGEREEKVAVRPTSDGWEVTVGGAVYRVDALPLQALDGVGLLSLRIGDGAHRGEHHEVSVYRRKGGGAGRYQVSDGTASVEVEVLDPLTHLARETHAGAHKKGLHQITAYMPGKVVTLLVEEGAQVEAGQGILVLEAMKMENEIQAEAPGILRRILVETGQAVEGGDPLFEIEG